MDYEILGVYEQVGFLKVRRSKVLEVVCDGIIFRNRTYSWSEFDVVRSLGKGAEIVFKDGAKCRIHLLSFRKEGEVVNFTRAGGNPAFEKLASFWYESSVKALKDPEVDSIESKVNSLVEDLLSATDDEEIFRLGRELEKATEKHIDLSRKHIGKLQEQAGKLRQSNNGVVLVVVLFLLLIGVLMMLNK